MSSNHRLLLFTWHSLICLLTLLRILSTGVNGQCTNNKWKCTNGDCIESHLLCDGQANCWDGSDETTTSCFAKRCPSYAFRCTYGACVSRKAECNGVQDCVDNSDELSANCGATNAVSTVTPGRSRCGHDKFECASRQCIPSENLCDGKADCRDGTDEVVHLCASTYCPSYGFRCGYGACVHGSSKCNGVADCLDGSDENEALCGNSNTNSNTPTSTEGSVPEQQPPSRCSLLVPTHAQVFYETASTIELYNGSLVEDFTSIVYRCRNGWNLLGSNTSFCVSGEWTNPAPSCLKYCSSRTLLSESTISNCEYKGIAIKCNSLLMPDTIARVSCAFGYRRVSEQGNDITVCGEDGYWDRNVLKCEPICGKEPDEGVSYIVGGEYTNNTKVPWHAGIYNDLGGQGRFVQSCGGTILTSRVVISAAHCFWDKSEGLFFDKSHFMVVVGKYYRDWNAVEPLQIQKISVQDIRSVPGYRDYDDLYNADMALLVLSKAIVFRSYVVPICMEYNLQHNEKYVQAGWEGRVAGWGLTVSGGNSSNELKVLDMPAIDYAECLRTVPVTFRRFVTSDKFCAGFTTGKSVCQGDSGGGLVFPQQVNGTQLYYLRGIVSSGANSHMSCDSDKYTVFTNVQFYSSLIFETVRQNY